MHSCVWISGISLALCKNIDALKIMKFQGRKTPHNIVGLWGFFNSFGGGVKFKI